MENKGFEESDNKFQRVTSVAPIQQNIVQAQLSASTTNATNVIPTPILANQSTSQNASLPQYHIAPNLPAQGSSKYSQLLTLLDELGKDIRPMYAGNRNCQDRLKRGIAHARVLVRDCIQEVEKNARQQQP